MITLQPLRADQYRQVAEWEFGTQPENTDWSRYYAEMTAPQWTHFGLYEGADFVGALSLEQTCRQVMSYHVVTAHRKVRSHELAEVLLTVAAFLFRHGFIAMTVTIPQKNRAAAILAIRCGMSEWRHSPSERFFMLTQSRFQRLNYGKFEAEADADALSEHEYLYAAVNRLDAGGSIVSGCPA